MLGGNGVKSNSVTELRGLRARQETSSLQLSLAKVLLLPVGHLLVSKQALSTLQLVLRGVPGEPHLCWS